VYVRVVRFADVTPDRIKSVVARIEQSGPPEGVPTTDLKVMFDEAQGTAVVFQYFETAEEMQAGARAMSAIDASETPGTRVSVDLCEMVIERTII
jgi:hypothetical protein